MNIPKAIEIIDDYLRGDEPDYGPDLPDSIRLAREALKAIPEYRDAAGSHNWPPLQGETEE